MDGDLAASGVPDGEQLGEESSRARHAAMVATELEEDEDEDATKETDCGDIDKVLDVAIPGAVHSGVAIGGGGRRRRGNLVHCGNLGIRVWVLGFSFMKERQTDNR